MAAKKPRPDIYKQGTRGPESADEMVNRLGFERSAGYEWEAKVPSPRK